MKYIFLGFDENKIRCEVSKEIEYFFPQEEFPFKFQVFSLLNKKILYEVEILPGMWATFTGYRDANAKVIGKTGTILKEYEYSYNDENLTLYEFWDYFARYNKKSIGLILGSGNGLWGEWVLPIHQNNIVCYLIEGSPSIFDELKENYKNYDNFRLHNIIISSNGENCDFYDFGEGGNSSSNVNYLKTLTPSVSLVVPEKKSTVSLNDFLEKYPMINWIRIDLEGIDFDLVMSLYEKNLKNIKMIQYEHLFLSEEKLYEIDLFMSNNGFDKKITFEIDTVYLKKNL